MYNKTSFTPKEFLEIVFKQLKEENLLTDHIISNEDSIIENLVKNFDQVLGDDFRFSLENLENRNIQKAVMGIIVSHSMGDEKNLNYFMDALTKVTDKMSQEPDPKAELKPGSEPNPELDQKLDHGIKLLLAVGSLSKTPTPRPTGKTLSDDIEEELKKSNLDDAKKAKIKQEVNRYEKEVSNCLRNLYGGDDPRHGGQIPTAILGPIVGNLYGFTCQGAPNPNSPAFMIEQITPHPGKADPGGTEKSLEILEVALGAILSDVYTSASRYMLAPHMTPPGTIGH